MTGSPKVGCHSTIMVRGTDSSMNRWVPRCGRVIPDSPAIPEGIADSLIRQPGWRKVEYGSSSGGGAPRSVSHAFDPMARVDECEPLSSALLPMTRAI